MNKGFWNGEPTATFVGVTYEVTKAEKPMWWQNQFVGKRRQGIQITYNDQTWVIDNQYGDGYFKVTKGMGSPRCRHASPSNPINVQVISNEDMNKELDYEGIAKEAREYDEWAAKADPEGFKRLLSLRAASKNF